jgi:glycine betaine/choline ABC-type transport system substrate-binding protein
VGPLRAIAALLAAASVIGCGAEPGSGPGIGTSQAVERVPGAQRSGTITVGSKVGPEQLLLGEIYSQALGAAGFHTRRRFGIESTEAAYGALREGRIDGYPEYVGTSLTTLFKVGSEDVATDRAREYRQARAEYAKRGITALAPSPFENALRLGALRATADRLGGIETTSQLARRAGNITLATPPECRDCAQGLGRAYGARFRRTLESDQPFEALDQRSADAALLSTTDARLTLPQYTLLADDRDLFPANPVSFGVRDETLRRIGREGREVIERVQRPLTVEVMREYNSRVVLDGDAPREVAASYLKEAGFVP